MKKNMLIFFSLILYSGGSMAIEEPIYSVVSKNPTYEVRKYEKILIAQTLVNEDFTESGNKAFRILADYIFGNNTTQEKIPMTAPVSQVKSEKISMTAPVNMIRSEKGFLVQFTMPRKYNLENIPKPNDSRVEILQIPARKVAVYRYSGSWSENTYRKNLNLFTEALKKDGLFPKSNPIFARYNSPFQIWFLKRNEIWFEL